MGKHSVFRLLLPQLLKTEPFSSSLLRNISSNFGEEYLEKFPNFSHFFTAQLLQSARDYALKLSSEVIGQGKIDDTHLRIIIDALTLEAENKEQFDSFNKTIISLDQINIDVNSQSVDELDAENTKLFAKLLVEIEDVKTNNVGNKSFEQIRPNLIKLSTVIHSSNIITNPKKFIDEYHLATNDVRKLAANHRIVEVPKGYKQILGVSVGDGFYLPNHFKCQAENREINVFLHNTQVLNPELFTRAIKIEFRPSGELEIPPIDERPLIYVPKEFYRQLYILQTGNYIYYLINNPIYSAFEFADFLQFFLSEMGLDRPGNLECNGKEIKFYWRHEEQGEYWRHLRTLNKLRQNKWE